MQIKCLVNTNAKRAPHKNKWKAGVVQVHVGPPSTPLIKIKHDDKLDKYFLNIKLCSNPKSEKSDPYEFKTTSFYNGNPEEFLLFIHNFNTNLAASVMLETAVKFQYLLTLVHVEALRHFE